MKKLLLTLLVITPGLALANPPSLPKIYPTEPPDILGAIQEQREFEAILGEEQYQSDLLEQQLWQQQEIARQQYLQQQDQLQQQQELQQEIQNEFIEQDLDRLDRAQRQPFQPE